MQASEFDMWREAYGRMTAAEHAEFYKKLHADHPDQRHFNGDDALAFFSEIPQGDLAVLELGGYDGELADLCLGVSNVKSWDNFDLAAPEQKCKDKRYCHHAIDIHLWNLTTPFEWDVFVASHVIEHLSERDLTNLLDYIRPCAFVYLDSPLHETDRTDWSGSTAAHKLALSWSEVDALMADRKFGHWAVAKGGAHTYRIVP